MPDPFRFHHTNYSFWMGSKPLLTLSYLRLLYWFFTPRRDFKIRFCSQGFLVKDKYNCDLQLLLLIYNNYFYQLRPTFTHLYCYIFIHLWRLKTHLDEFLYHLLWVTLPCTGQSPEVPSNPNDFVHMHPACPHLLQKADTDQDYSKCNFFYAQWYNRIYDFM